MPLKLILRGFRLLRIKDKDKQIKRLRGHFRASERL